MKLILFDIDGTLLHSGRAGSDAMTLAFQELFQIDQGFAHMCMAGKTDPAILHEALVRHRLQEEATTFARFHERYIVHLPRLLQEPGRRRRLMPGIPALLDALASRANMLLGILTGNVALGARLKLEAFGLGQYFRLGAYGSDAGDRNALVPIAQQRAKLLLGHDIPSTQIVVIGDTPRDILCARSHGARAVAVATGSYSCQELQQYRPDHCFTDLSEVQAVVRVLESV